MNSHVAQRISCKGPCVSLHLADTFFDRAQARLAVGSIRPRQRRILDRNRADAGRLQLLLGATPLPRRRALRGSAPGPLRNARRGTRLRGDSRPSGDRPVSRPATSRPARRSQPEPAARPASRDRGARSARVRRRGPDRRGRRQSGAALRSCRRVPSPDRREVQSWASPGSHAPARTVR